MSNVISRIRSTGQSIRVRRRKLRKLVDSILTLISRCCLFSASGHWCCSSKFTLFWPTSLLLLASAKPWHSSAAAEHRRTKSNPCLYCEARGLKLKPLAIRIEAVACFLPRSLQRLRNAVTIPRSLLRSLPRDNLYGPRRVFQRKTRSQLQLHYQRKLLLLLLLLQQQQQQHLAVVTTTTTIKMIMIIIIIILFKT